MKFLVVLALAALVNAEADPQLLYKSLLPTTYVQQPLVHKQVVQPLVYKQQVAQPLVYSAAVPKTIQASPGVSLTTLHKREAEAEHHLLYKTIPAIQPLVYSKPVVQPLTYVQQPLLHKTIVQQPIVQKQVVTPVVYNAPVLPVQVKTYANDAEKPQEYAAKGKYVAENAGAIHIAKREAEAEPWNVYAGAMPVTTYAHTPVVQPLTYVQQPVVYNAPIKSIANDAVKPFNYAAKGKYVANSAGVVHVAKREAEPYTIGYNTWQTSPLSYVSAPIVTPSIHSGLTYSHIFKREAEAEAEPWTVYGGAYSPYSSWGYRAPLAYNGWNYGYYG